MKFFFNRLIYIAAIFACASLLMAGFSIYWLFQEESERQEENIKNDLFACERGNVLREDLRRLAAAGRNLDQEILDIIFMRVDDPQTVVILNEALQPAFERYEGNIREIKDVNCLEVVLGVREN